MRILGCPAVPQTGVAQDGLFDAATDRDKKYRQQAIDYMTMTESEVDLFVQALLLPPPFGFTEAEKKQILDWLKNDSIFIEIVERRTKPI